jgi:putative ATP-dependent endonuclease of the OLD family
MKIEKVRLCNFQSFGPTPTTIDLEEITYVLGPNGSGKTAALEALSRLFSPLQVQRRVQPEDFHVPMGRTPEDLAEEERKLWLEAEVSFPEAADDDPHPSVPPNFAHMSIDSADGTPGIRVRLSAVLAADGEVDEKLEYVLEVGEDGEPVRTSNMSRHDRGHIEVHYLPARRDPAHQIAYTAASLIGRTLRAADWTSERGALRDLTSQLTAALTENKVVENIGIHLEGEWTGLHKGAFFHKPAIAFGRGELEGVLNQLTVTFSPSHSGTPLPFERLSDGQKSLLYIALVLSWQEMSRKVLAQQEGMGLDPIRLRPPVHTVIALEEPENSLAPQYLGRIVRQLREACGKGDSQALIATHASTLLRRVQPEAIRFLRLDSARQTTVSRVHLPSNDEEAAKYVREAVEAFPELYFARMVVLGEGASEQVVLPRVLAAAGIAEDDASVSVVPLGGRHVNHFWRLLSDLGIPHVTLLDLDSARHHGGWGRVRNAMKQINKVNPRSYAEPEIDGLPKWDADEEFPRFDASSTEESSTDRSNAVKKLEAHGVFFSHPVDLDLMMLAAFGDAYGTNPREPDEKTLIAVLGKGRAREERIDAQTQKLYEDYREKFDLKSKPATHLAGLAQLTNDELVEGLPDVLGRLVSAVRSRLALLPE